MERPIDLSNCASATLTFWWLVRTELNYDFVYLQYYTSSWITAWNLSGVHDVYFEQATVDIPVDATSIRFWFHSDGSGLDEGVYIDDILLDASVIGIEEDVRRSITAPLAMHVFPNPFSDRMNIRCWIRGAQYRMADISLQIFDIVGKKVRDLSGNLTSCISGHSFEVSWSGDDDAGRRLPAGVYFVKLENKDREEIEKVISLR
jgi:hypothetical protein